MGEWPRIVGVNSTSLPYDQTSDTERHWKTCQSAMHCDVLQIVLCALITSRRARMQSHNKFQRNRPVRASLSYWWCNKFSACFRVREQWDIVLRIDWTNYIKCGQDIDRSIICAPEVRLDLRYLAPFRRAA